MTNGNTEGDFQSDDERSNGQSPKPSDPFWPKGFFPRIWLAIQLVGFIISIVAATIVMGWVVWTVFTSDVSISDDRKDCFILVSRYC